MTRRVVSILLVLALVLTSGDFTAFAAERTDAVESAVEEEAVKESCSIGEEEFAEEKTVEQGIMEESETENEKIIDSSELDSDIGVTENSESFSITKSEDVSEEEFFSNAETDLFSETEAESISGEDKNELDNS